MTLITIAQTNLALNLKVCLSTSSLSKLCRSLRTSQQYTKQLGSTSRSRLALELLQQSCLQIKLRNNIAESRRTLALSPFNTSSAAQNSSQLSTQRSAYSMTKQGVVKSQLFNQEPIHAGAITGVYQVNNHSNN